MALGERFDRKPFLSFFLRLIQRRSWSFVVYVCFLTGMSYISFLIYSFACIPTFGIEDWLIFRSATLLKVNDHERFYPDFISTISID